MSDLKKYITSLSEQKLMRRLTSLILQSPDKCYCCVYYHKECSNRDCYTGISAFVRQIKTDRQSLK